jgi:glycosyltransferase involved in cell wall biosynthesis
MACGRVLLASDIPAAREIIDEGRTGFLFGVGDVEALAASLVRLAGDPKLRGEVGRAARDEVVLRHNLDDTAGRYAELLGDLCRT